MQNVKIAIVEPCVSSRDRADLKIFVMRTPAVLAALRRDMANELL